jgi:hypothetical protein
MSHHYSGPDFGFPHGDARLDLTDLYAFPKPGRKPALLSRFENETLRIWEKHGIRQAGFGPR